MKRRLKRLVSVIHVPLVAVVVASLLGALAAPPASALSKAAREEFLPFADCPSASAQICVVADTTGGEFVIGRKTVPISKPILLQGGLPQKSLEEQGLLAAVGGETLAKVAEEVPGGLVGIAGLGGAVTATAELAAPIEAVKIYPLALATRALGNAVTLPLKVKLSNELLGEDCYIGSDAEPIVLHLTDGVTQPPEGVEAIEGSRSEAATGAKGRILEIPAVKLVDNTFAVPGAKGCGGPQSEALLDEIIDLDIGLPSKAGSNKAIMTGSVEQTITEDVTRYLPKPKKKREK